MLSPRSADVPRLVIAIGAAPPHAVEISGPGLGLSGEVPAVLLPGAPAGLRAAGQAPRNAAEILNDFRASGSPNMGQIGDAMRAVLGLSAAAEAELGLWLQSPGDLELVIEPGPDWAAALPWEALRLPGAFLPALAPRIRMYRRAPGTASRRAVSPPVPLRVLVVNGLPGPQAEPKAEYGRREVSLVRSLLWGAGLERHDVRVLSTATWPNAAPLVTEVQEFEPHVLHIVCHGDAGGGENDSRLLLGEKPDCYWTGDAISATFSHAPDLVVLHACWGGAQAANARSIAQAFLQAGVGAIWSMQGNLDVAHAEPLTERLYRELAEHGDVARAAAAARRFLVAGRGVAHGDRAWAIPALTIRGDAYCPFPTRPSGRLRLAALKPDHLPPLVDRKECFAELWKLQDGVTILSGPEQQGKSHLARWLVARAQAAGQLACRLEAAAEGMIVPNPLAELMEAALSGLWVHPTDLPLAVRTFVHDYAELSSPNQREPPPMPQGWEPPAIRLEGDLRGLKKSQIFERFVASVKASAPESGLLIVVDLNKIDVRKGDLFPDFAEGILRPWSLSRAANPARLVIVMRDKQREALDAELRQTKFAEFTSADLVSLPTPRRLDISVAVEELLDLADGIRTGTGKSPLPSPLREIIVNAATEKFADMLLLWSFALGQP